MPQKAKAVFLDRDGVLNDVVDRGENFVVAGKKVRWTAPWTYDEFRLKEGVAESLRSIGDLGFVRVLVTNQPDIAYGTMTREAHERIMARTRELPFDRIEVCLHTRYEGCECKKPKAGMLLRAAAALNIDLASSYIIGDTSDDVGAGKAAGCATILIDAEQNRGLSSDWRVKSLSEAVEVIGEHI